MTVQADFSGICSETTLCSQEVAQILAYKNMICHLMNLCKTMQYSDFIQLNAIKYSHFDLRIIKDLTILLLTWGEFIDCATILLVHFKITIKSRR